MKIRVAISLFILFLCNCENTNDIVVNNQLEVNLDDQKWLSNYGQFTINDTINYTDGGFSVIQHRISSRLPVDCRVVNEPNQCQYEIITFSFHSPSENSTRYVTLFLFGNRDLIANASDRPILSPEIFLFNNFDNSILNPQDDKYLVDYFAEGNNLFSNEIIKVETTDTSRIFGSKPPKEFLLVKDIGITEWASYNGVRHVTQ